jgi:protein-S-isoprenylcysteine O-methyltransferase Ste14
MATDAMGRRGVPWITAAGLRVAGANVTLALLNLAFGYAHLQSFLMRQRPSVALAMTLEAVVAILALVRREPRTTTTSLWAWTTTLVGTYGILLLRPTAAAADVPVADMLQAFGTMGAVMGALSLNRCFGLLPAFRGIKTNGSYRVVRHPLYSAYLIANAGYVISNPSIRNALILGFSNLAQIARILNEERLLSEHPEYEAYKCRTRWRLVPFVF